MSQSGYEYDSFSYWYSARIAEVEDRIESFPQNNERRTKEELLILLKDLERGWQGVMEKELERLTLEVINS